WGYLYSSDGPSHRYHREFVDALFGEGKLRLGMANHDSKHDNLYRIDESCMRWCCYGTNLFGDPALLIHTSAPDEVWVDDDWAGSSEGEEVGYWCDCCNTYYKYYGVNAFSSIQDGIDAVAEGGTVHVAEGTYDGGLTIDKRVTVVGAGKNQTSIGTSSSPVITVSADDVTIRDLEITDDPELVEGIRVVSPASWGLTVENVAFTDIGNAGGNAYGIKLETSFSGLTVKDSEFIAVYHTSQYRGIGIFAVNSLNLDDFDVTGSTFERLFTGIYLRSAIDGLVASGNTFGPFQLSDCTACVAGIYIGDGDDYNFDIKNVTITGNTFTEYGRGVYVWNYAQDAVVKNVDIYGNTFADAIWSSAVRVIAGLGTDKQVSFDGIYVHDNVLTQDSDVGAHVGLIDFRTYCELQSCDIAVTNNEITLRGTPYDDPVSGILFLAYEGPFTNTVIEANTLDGGGAGGAGTPPSSGILLIHQSSTYWPSGILEMEIRENEITAFDHGVSIYDLVNTQYGGLPAGSVVKVNYNNIHGNALYGLRNDNGEAVDASYNYWGHASGPDHPDDNPFGQGDNVSDTVDFSPWLDAPYPYGQPTANTPWLTVDLPSHLVVGDDWTEFSGTATNPTSSIDYSHVLFNVTLSGIPSLTAGDLDLEYWTGSAWQDMTLSGTGTITTWYGPSGGFPMPAGYTADSQYRIKILDGAPMGELTVLCELTNVDNSYEVLASYAGTVGIFTTNEVWVDDDWAGSSEGEQVGCCKYYGVNAFSSIQDGIDAVAAGGIVHVADGLYSQSLMITKNVIMKGTDTPVIAPSTPVPTTTIPESSATWEYVVCVKGGPTILEVVIDGFEIDGQNAGTAGHPTRYVGLLWENATGTVSNCYLHDLYYSVTGDGSGQQTFGVAVYGDSAIDIVDNTIQEFSRGGIGVNGDAGPMTDPTASIAGNMVYGNGLETATGWWAENGIQIGHGAGGSITGNTVTDCQVNNPSWVSCGIMIYDAAPAVEITGNTVTSCDTGLSICSPSFDLVEDNSIGNCRYDALRLGWPADNITVRNNELYGSELGLTVYDASDNLIENNDIHDNDYGIWMDGASYDNTFTANDIYLNTFDGVHIEPYYGATPSGAVMQYNNIYDNGGYGLYNTADPIDASYNYWGHAYGPYDVDGNWGDGAAVSDNVDYLPWLDAPYPVGSPVTGIQNVDTGVYYMSIQDAIDAASAGNTIVVLKGLYSEQVTIDKGLTLTGVGGAVIDGGSGIAIQFRSPGPELLLSGVRIANVTLRGLAGASFDGAMWPEGLTVEDVEFDTCVFNATDYDSIGITHGAQVTNLTVRNSMFQTSTNTDNAIGISGTSTLVDGLTITGGTINVATTGTSQGLLVFGGATVTNMTIEGVTFNNPERSAIMLQDCTVDGAVVTNCEVIGDTSSSTGYGIYMGSSVAPATISDFVVSNVLFVNQRESAIIGFRQFDVSNLTIQDCVFEDNRGHITFYRLGDPGTLTDILIEGNTFGDLLGWHCIWMANGVSFSVDDVVVRYNNFVSGGSAINNAVAVTIDAECNWWGEATGATHVCNPGGLGDSVSDYVDFIPWLTAAAPEGTCEGTTLLFSVLDLEYSTDGSTWLPVTGGYPHGYELLLDYQEAWYYLNVSTVTADVTLDDGDYGFCLDPSSVPGGFYAYWETRDVYEGCTGWQQYMWEIINGRMPMFYLKVYNSGSSYMLVDGLMYALGQGDQPLRVDGDYPLGDYVFTAEIEYPSGATTALTVEMSFAALREEDDDWSYREGTSDIYNKNQGNVGINTQTPETQLDVNGSLRVQGNSMTHLFFVDASSERIGIGTNNPIATLDVHGDFRVAGTMINPTLFFASTSTNRIGIGTNSPKSILDIEQTSGIAEIRLASLDHSAQVSVDTRANTNNKYAFYLFRDKGVNKYGYIYRQDSGNFYMFDYTNNWHFLDYDISEPSLVANIGNNNIDFRVESTNNNHMLFVDASSDRIGIGTSNPTSTLDVDGDIEIGSDDAFYFGEPGDDGTWRIIRSG
ncbi:MAG: right-handed parallel beta-helix repeat-containing protein, partial [Thermoplasmatota archaeon]